MSSLNIPEPILDALLEIANDFMDEKEFYLIVRIIPIATSFFNSSYQVTVPLLICPQTDYNSE